MSQESLENFGAYRLATELFHLVVEDMGDIKWDWRVKRLVSQQVASADSICANIEEGHGRETSRDYTHYLVMARGSTRETRGRYLRMKHWLTPELIADRVKRCDAILGILSKTINTLRTGAGPVGRETRVAHVPQAPSLKLPPSSKHFSTSPNDPRPPSPPAPPATPHASPSARTHRTSPYSVPSPLAPPAPSLSRPSSPS